MEPSSPHRPLWPIALFTLALPAFSQTPGEGGAPADPDDSPILLRVLCKDPTPGAAELQIVQGEGTLHQLDLAPSSISEPLAIARGDFFLAARGADGATPVLKATIPGAGRRFVLALMPPQRQGQPYEHRLVRIDDKPFDVSDLMLFNLTGAALGGTLGSSQFTLPPGGSTVVTPRPEDDGDRVYQCRFYLRQGDETRLFNDTRWPLSRTARIFLFFIPDPERGSIGYHAFREYQPFP